MSCSRLLRIFLPNIHRRVVLTPLLQSDRFCQTNPDSNEGNFERKLYNERSPNEPIDKKRARLLYQSRKRGILENDLLLSSFAAKYLKTMDLEELDKYDLLINTTSNEWDIYYWAVGVKEVPEEFQNSVMQKFIQHAQNENREQRFRQPDL